MPYVRTARPMAWTRAGGARRRGRGLRGLGDCYDSESGVPIDCTTGAPVATSPVFVPVPVVSTSSPSPSPSSLDQLFASLAVGGEQILGKVVAPQYQQTCNAAGCTTTVAGGGGAATPGVPGAGLSSNTLLIGGGLLAVLVLAMAMKGK